MGKDLANDKLFLRIQQLEERMVSNYLEPIKSNIEALKDDVARNTKDILDCKKELDAIKSNNYANTRTND